MLTKLFAGAAAVAVVAFLGWSLRDVMLKQAADPFADCRSSAVSGAAQIGGPFSLTDQSGKPFTDQDLAKGPALVYFGYTFCPDVCPLDNARNAEAIDILQQKGFDVTPVFITIDPERDTPEMLADFAASMHPKMIGLTGTPEQIRVAANAYKAYYKKQDTKDQFYMMDHSTFSYLMLPNLGFAEFFTRDDTAEQIAKRTACFLEKS